MPPSPWRRWAAIWPADEPEPLSMTKPQFARRRDGRMAAMQYLYAWSINPPANLEEDLRWFFENQDQPRDHYSFGEEVILGVIAHSAEIDGHIRGLAQNWDFDRVAKIDLAQATGKVRASVE